MKGIAFLCIIYISRLCTCGEVRGRNSATRKQGRNGKGVESTVNKDNDPPTGVPSEPDGSTLDLAEPNESLCYSFDYSLDDVPSRMIILRDGASVTSLTVGNTEIWASRDGVGCSIISVRLKDGEPVLVHVVVTVNGSGRSMTISKNMNKWTVGRSSGEFRNLRVETGSSSRFDIDLMLSEDSTNCRVFQAQLDGIPTRFYAPKAGFNGKKVICGRSTIWQCESTKCCRCRKEKKRATITRAHLKNDRPYLVQMTIKDSKDSADSYNFIYEDGNWKSINKITFEVKRLALKKEYQKEQNTSDEDIPSDDSNASTSDIDI
ncbi:hypothetical protein BEWA_015920 [Theileria equi strain WA]|uniref:Signal peptide containing protein n=1 Tax=Theileria equi strain WA TaxID=1537102 RepID=L1LCG1_THEEQ|nr:hypothetical protein BEWA_015920 [Theileria equi strain WA]EKX73031.1 hypothetical protein BEWA_015920 [Theileria equi strain WA]|eukprot:XP_004832483.1 hypothetical protein BEWA_015920 [Theileria equi strain WA]